MYKASAWLGQPHSLPPKLHTEGLCLKSEQELGAGPCSKSSTVQDEGLARHLLVSLTPISHGLRVSVKPHLKVPDASKPSRHSRILLRQTYYTSPSMWLPTKVYQLLFDLVDPSSVTHYDAGAIVLTLPSKSAPPTSLLPFPALFFFVISGSAGSHKA